MAKVKITGHASGTGILTVTAPNTSTDRTITLPDADVTLGAAFSVADITGATALAEQPAQTDEMIISDAGTLKRLDISHMSNTPAFQAHNSASQTGLSDGTYNKVAFNTQDFSTGGTYDTTNHRWTPGVIGKYYIAFHAHALAAAASTLKQLYVRIYKNGASIDESDGGRDDQDNRGMGGNFMSSVIVTMDADDYVEAYIFMNTHAQDFNITGGTLNGGAFYGYRLIGA